jgi:DNA-binding XRE family transcriptional regulator
MYRNLRIALAEACITNEVLAKYLGVVEKTIRNKLNGESEWTWTEALAVSALLPKYSMKWLMTKDTADNNPT